jgi:subtilisin-like proprotein convertase family protein
MKFINNLNIHLKKKPSLILRIMCVILILHTIIGKVNGQTFDSTIFIPDGPNCPQGLCYNTNVTITTFPSGDTIESANDILSFCINMEHSFVGDLNITVICPNGQSCIMKSFINSGGAYMGVPYGGTNHSTYDNGCDSANNPHGTGWNYCWSQTYPNIGTINSHSNQSLLDSTHISSNSGYYLPDQDFSQLIGCPLNGTWDVQICDNWALDNGYVFGWALNLDSLLLEAPTMNGLDDNLISIYPNPVTNILQIQTVLKINNIEITDISGRLLYSSSSKTIDCRDLPEGVYFARFVTEKGINVKKFMKQ